MIWRILVKKILIYRKTGNKLVDVSDRLHGLLCIYKMFWPPDATIKLGKKVLVMKEFTPWPPPEQVPLLEVEEKKKERNQDMG